MLCLVASLLVVWIFTGRHWGELTLRIVLPGPPGVAGEEVHVYAEANREAMFFGTARVPWRSPPLAALDGSVVLLQVRAEDPSSMRPWCWLDAEDELHYDYVGGFGPADCQAEVTIRARPPTSASALEFGAFATLTAWVAFRMRRGWTRKSHIIEMAVAGGAVGASILARSGAGLPGTLLAGVAAACVAGAGYALNSARSPAGSNPAPGALLQAALGRHRWLVRTTACASGVLAGTAIGWFLRIVGPDGTSYWWGACVVLTIAWLAGGTPRSGPGVLGCSALAFVFSAVFGAGSVGAVVAVDPSGSGLYLGSMTVAQTVVFVVGAVICARVARPTSPRPRLAFATSAATWLGYQAGMAVVLQRMVTDYNTGLGISMVTAVLGFVLAIVSVIVTFARFGARLRRAGDAGVTRQRACLEVQTGT